MVRKTKQEAAVTRSAILEAAVEVFASVGVAGASLEQIAQAAGVTRGAVYWHFKNKPAVFYALYDQLYTPFYEMILHDLEQDPPEPLQQLENLCIRLFLELADDVAKQRVLSIFFLKCDYAGDMREVMQCQLERKQRSITLFALYFERALRKGQLAAGVDPHVLTLSLLSYLTGMTYEYLRMPEVFQIKVFAPQMLNSFFRGIRA